MTFYGTEIFGYRFHSPTHVIVQYYDRIQDLCPLSLSVCAVSDCDCEVCLEEEEKRMGVGGGGGRGGRKYWRRHLLAPSTAGGLILFRLPSPLSGLI